MRSRKRRQCPQLYKGPEKSRLDIISARNKFTFPHFSPTPIPPYGFCEIRPSAKNIVHARFEVFRTFLWDFISDDGLAMD